MLYVDTNVLIGAFELPEPPAALVGALLDHASGPPLITSTITLSEVLVGPLRRGDGTLERFYRRLFRRTDLIRLKAVTQPVLLHAAVLRATTPMRLPDASMLRRPSAPGAQSCCRKTSGWWSGAP